MKSLSKKTEKANIPLCLILGAAMAFFVKAFALDFFRVSGKSMEPAIHDTETVAVNKLAYGLQNPFKPELLFSWKKAKRGEIIFYMYQNYWVVKRCAAESGAPLECVDENGSYFLLAEGSKIPLSSIQYHKLRTTKSVPKGYILAIGDNYELSRDSRDYGFVPEKNVVSRAVILRRHGRAAQ